VLIKNLKINNLRNLKSVDIDLHPELNFLVGTNGAGKTSVLEALVVLAKGRSFRSGQIESLIGPDTGTFRVVTSTRSDNGIAANLGIERSKTDWKARRDGEDVRQLGDLAIFLPLVLIEPNSHQLIGGPPDGRRRFLDWGVFHVEQSFLLEWRRYSRALKQRNAALRQQDAETVASLDRILAPLGESVTHSRQKQYERLVPEFNRTLAELSPELKGIKLSYDKGWKSDSLETSLRESLKRDFDRSGTGPGPHRADILVHINRKAARDRLSRGEQKICAAALLLTQARMMDAAGEKPLLLMDDLASEFDGHHVDAVIGAGRQMRSQVWITGTSKAPYASFLTKDHRLFHVEQGLISS
jgi:DNA replication and repair protein RecF